MVLTLMIWSYACTKPKGGESEEEEEDNGDEGERAEPGDWLLSRSPDGNKIAFDSGRDGNREIYITNFDGAGLIRLTNRNTNI